MSEPATLPDAPPATPAKATTLAEPTTRDDQTPRDVPDPANTPLTGLTEAEVAERQRDGKTNLVEDSAKRSVGDIVRANVLTRFNAIITALAAVVLVVGSRIDALFAVVLVVNTAIGIVEEVIAKRTLDRLQVLVAPTVTVLRDGTEAAIGRNEVVLDDLVLLHVGDQIPVDGRVLVADGLEIDESALTGEADAVPKAVDNEVLAGSIVVAGSASIVAVRVGADAWIETIVLQAREFAPTSSELRRGVDRILRVISWALPPLAALLVWSQLRAHRSTGDALVSSVAGVVGLVPQGLVLMISVAMAAAVRRLARQHVVVQELQAVEGLARIDILCVDKTGTLTTGKLTLDKLEPIDIDLAKLQEALAALAASEASPTSTMKLLAPAVGTAPNWSVASQTPFSSARKWSSSTFTGQGTWVLGAPEVLLDAISPDSATAVRENVDALTMAGRRVMLVAHSDGESAAETLPDTMLPKGLVVLVEELRPDAAATMAFFAKQKVTLKVISGDSPRTVSAVAQQLGIEGADKFVDLRDHQGTLDEIANNTTVFGRVSPEQKSEIVEALQRAGHVVAMTGDGVNDIPALKRADIGIAMDTATAATKAVAQLVLLDGRFDRLPSVVAEGRRVVANMERVSSLFVTKTIYAAVFAVVIGISGGVFPFLPRHLSLVSELTVGIPAFVLSFRKATDASRPGYLKRVLRFSVPAGLVTAAVTLTTYWIVRSPVMHASLNEGRTASTFALAVMSFWILSLLMKPIDKLDGLLLSVLIAAFVVIGALASTRKFYALDLLGWRDAIVGGATAVISVIVLNTILRHRESGEAGEAGESGKSGKDTGEGGKAQA